MLYLTFDLQIHVLDAQISALVTYKDFSHLLLDNVSINVMQAQLKVSHYSPKTVMVVLTLVVLNFIIILGLYCDLNFKCQNSCE